ncbi:hypothetical protein D6777_01970 [Candidatus Woesearchaeota archaeon]|nr:MAG: hypothetical protein D6777_01970 [Candidatus Woesearchaeota archaeon]
MAREITETFYRNLELKGHEVGLKLIKKKESLDKLIGEISTLEEWKELIDGLKNPETFIKKDVLYSFVRKIDYKKKLIDGCPSPYLMVKFPSSEDYNVLVRRCSFNGSCVETFAFTINFEEMHIVPIALRRKDYFKVRDNLMFKVLGYDKPRIKDECYPLSNIIKI